MSTVHICLKDILGVAVKCEVIFYPGDTPFQHGAAMAVSGRRSVWLDAEGQGSTELLAGRYVVRFGGIAGNTDALIIEVPDDSGTHELVDLISAGNWILPVRDMLQKAKNFADVADAAAAFAAIKQPASPSATGVVQLATQAEVNAGSDAAKAVTPATLAGASALTSLATTVSGKADASAVTALASTISAKADSSTVTALASTVSAKADSSTVTALASTVSAKADSSAVTALASTVSAKADSSTVAALASTVSAKADSSTVTALASTVSAKADASALSGKADVSALPKSVTVADSAALLALASSDVKVGDYVTVTAGDSGATEYYQVIDVGQLGGYAAFSSLRGGPLYSDAGRVQSNNQGALVFNTPDGIGRMRLGSSEYMDVFGSYSGTIYFETDSGQARITATSYNVLEIVGDVITFDGTQVSFPGMMYYDLKDSTYPRFTTGTNRLYIQTQNANIASFRADGLYVDKGMGVFGTTPPTAQPSAIANATDLASALTAINALLVAVRKYGMIAS